MDSSPDYCRQLCKLGISIQQMPANYRAMKKQKNTAKKSQNKARKRDVEAKRKKREWENKGNGSKEGVI